MQPIPELFADYPEGSNLNVINTNIVSVTAMSQMVIPIMLKQKTCPHAKRPKGLIINISSSAALVEVPMLSIYGACKYFDAIYNMSHKFSNSQSLHELP